MVPIKISRIKSINMMWKSSITCKKKIQPIALKLRIHNMSDFGGMKICFQYVWKKTTLTIIVVLLIFKFWCNYKKYSGPAFHAPELGSDPLQYNWRERQSLMLLGLLAEGGSCLQVAQRVQLKKWEHYTQLTALEKMMTNWSDTIHKTNNGNVDATLLSL